MLLLSEEFRQRCVERRGDAIEKDDRDVAFSGFELSEVAFGDVGEFGEIFSRERARFAKRADPSGQLAQEQRVGWRRSSRKNRAGIVCSGHVIGIIMQV